MKATKIERLVTLRKVLEDWNENEATDFCQYMAFIDPKDMSHILLASYCKEEA